MAVDKDIQRLIDQVMDQLRQRGEKVHTTGVYKEEPLLRTAAQMVSDAAKAAAASAVSAFADGERRLPERYNEMRRLAVGANGWRQTDSQVFYRQALFMADFEDDFDYRGEFAQYYPTYEAMNSLQLRGYFSWRTRVRRGDIKAGPLPFAFVYIYELLHLVGAADALDAYRKLQHFWRVYRGLDKRVENYLRRWMTDFVVYYRLDPSLLPSGVTDRGDDKLLVLLHYDQYDDAQLFDALSALSSYDLSRSRLYRTHPQDVQAVVCGVWRDLSVYYDKHRHAPLFERLFGHMARVGHRMFDSAVFYDRMPPQNYEYPITPLYIYHCVGGNWSVEQFIGLHQRNRELGAILKTVDSLMRPAFGVNAPIQPGNNTRLLQSIVLQNIDKRLAENRQNAIPKVEVDLSRLADIRAAAAHTRDRLLTEEDRGQSPPAAGPTPAVERADVPAAGAAAALPAPVMAGPAPGDLPSDIAAATFDAAAPATDDLPPAAAFTPDTAASAALPTPPPAATGAALPFGLTAGEAAFLQALLYGQPVAQALQAHGMLASLAADAVNEKLFDHFADTVVVFEGDVPVLLEDYTEELKGFLPL